MKSIFYPDLDLLYHDATHRFDAVDFEAVGALVYRLDAPPNLSIWDFGDSESAFELDEVRSMAAPGPSEPTFTVRGRDDGKTAIVASHPLSFGRARQYVSYSGQQALPFSQQVFRSLDEALAWLGISAETLAAAEHVDFYQS